MQGHVGYTVTTGQPSKTDEVVPHFYHQPPVGAASGSDLSQSASRSASARVADMLLGNSVVSSVVPSQRNVTVAPGDSGGAETSQQVQHTSAPPASFVGV